MLGSGKTIAATSSFSVCHKCRKVLPILLLVTFSFTLADCVSFSYRQKKPPKELLSFQLHAPSSGSSGLLVLNKLNRHINTCRRECFCFIVCISQLVMNEEHCKMEISFFFLINLCSSITSLVHHNSFMVILIVFYFLQYYQYCFHALKKKENTQITCFNNQSFPIACVRIAKQNLNTGQGIGLRDGWLGISLYG